MSRWDCPDGIPRPVPKRNPFCCVHACDPGSQQSIIDRYRGDRDVKPPFDFPQVGGGIRRELSYGIVIQGSAIAEPARRAWQTLIAQLQWPQSRAIPNADRDRKRFTLRKCDVDSTVTSIQQNDRNPF